MKYQPLTRKEIISVIEGKGAATRIPIMLQYSTHEEQFDERKEVVTEIKDSYPEDVQIIRINMPEMFDAPPNEPEYRWVNFDNPYKDQVVGIDAQIALKDWENFDEILKDFPDPNYEGLFSKNTEDDGRYRLVNWWNLLFERHWKFRGMTDALMDFYIAPNEVHRLYRAVTDFYLVVIERAKQELNADGIFVSDDLGTQNSPFFAPEIFDEFFKPYYKEIIEKAHSLGMHFWLHTCGNVEILLPKFVEIGLDVIHPIQKYTMDEKKVALQYGNDICIWAGFDVQQIIPWGTSEEVRQEVRYLMDTYYRQDGRFMFTAGNAINGDCRLDSLEALYDESFKYGSSISRHIDQEDEK